MFCKNKIKYDFQILTINKVKLVVCKNVKLKFRLNKVYEYSLKNKKRAFDIQYQLTEAKLNQENCQWLGGENVEKKPLRFGFESLQRLLGEKFLD